MSVREPLVSLSGVSKTWRAGKEQVGVLRGIDLDVFPGESLAIVGPSGAGKSTLLHIIGLLTPADQGTIHFAGREVTSEGIWWDSRLRWAIGMIFQDAKLLAELTLLQNVCVPLGHRGIWPARQASLAREALASVGLDHRLTHRPNQLSGGELMRAAIARAIVTKPSLMLADEPTGSLDSKNGQMVADLLLGMVTAQRALVIVTHHMPLAERATRLLRIHDGALVDGQPGRS
jgi:ABC-type lipoprotein export system ATPase subunit